MCWYDLFLNSIETEVSIIKILLTYCYYEDCIFSQTIIVYCNQGHVTLCYFSRLLSHIDAIITFSTSCGLASLLIALKLHVWGNSLYWAEACRKLCYSLVVSCYL